MNATKLAMQRALWSAYLKGHLGQMSGYTVREYVNDYATLFTVTHPETPDWKATVGICSAHEQKNRLEVDRKFFASAGSLRKATMLKLVDLLKEMRRRHAAAATKARETEATAAAWLRRQEAELANVALPDWMSAEIIKAGPYEGRYRVTFEDGNPLERLTLQQLMELRSLCYHFAPKS